jgi:triosephosphate isomerase (TIM)
MNDVKKALTVIANWKMHRTISEAKKYVTDLAPLIQGSLSQVYLAAPFTMLSEIAPLCRASNIVLGAQNMNDHDEGAFTGEISGKMLKDAGADFVILGHSERRTLFHESNDFVNRKVKKAIDVGLVPVVCIGETAAERDSGNTANVLSYQLRYSLAGVNSEQIGRIMIAYEPLWAIGTQQAAMPAVAQEMHLFCRRYIEDQYGKYAAEKVSILYGGSVKPDNAKVLSEQKDVDGLLVGGASLSVESFEKIVNFPNGIL